MGLTTHADGHVAQGYGKVADACARNFSDGRERGAAFSLYRDGEQVVDLWDGVADAERGTTFGPGTLVMVRSATKGVLGLVMARLAEAGQVALDEPVARLWPEFAASGKSRVTLAQLLGHQAGLVAVDTRLTLSDLLAGTPVVRALAAQRPLWDPGTAHGYHAFTLGWAVAELVRRVTGQRIGEVVHDTLARPLGAEFWIGLPTEHVPRLAMLEQAPAPDDERVRALLAHVLTPGTLAYRSLTMDGVIHRIGGDGEPLLFNTSAYRAGEVPAGNGVTTARSLARIYAAAVAEVDGVRLLGREGLEAVRRHRVAGTDAVLGLETAFSLGFWLDSPSLPLLGPASFGHLGAGGSLGFADPETGVGFGYVTNRLGVLGVDERALSLVDAVRAVV